MNSQPPLGGDINPAKPGGFIWPRKALTEGMEPGDPYTPLLRAYEGDRVQVRIVAGAHMLPHAFTVGGMKWLFEPSWDDSGWRSSQSMGISEHFEFIFETPRASPSDRLGAQLDRLPLSAGRVEPETWHRRRHVGHLPRVQDRRRRTCRG